MIYFPLRRSGEMVDTRASKACGATRASSNLAFGINPLARYVLYG